MDLSLNESFFDMAYNCQNNMTSFEKLIQHLDENRQNKGSGEVNFQKLHEETEKLLQLLEKKTNRDCIKKDDYQHALNNQGVIDIQMSISSIPVKMFIGQVPRDWQESDLKIFFEKHTSITNIEIKRDEKNRHQGCAFITFSSITEAERISEFYKTKHFPNSKNNIFMRWASGEADRLGISENSSHKLIIKNLPTLISDKSLSNIFENFGGIQELKVIRDQVTKECKGHAFLKYYSKESAHLAVQNLSSQKIYLIEKEHLKVSFLEKSYQKKQKQLKKHLKQEPASPNCKSSNDPTPASIPYEKYYYEYTYEEEQQPMYFHPYSGQFLQDTPPHSSLIWKQDGSCFMMPKLFPCHIDFSQNLKKANQIKYTPQQIVVQGPSFSNLFVFHLPKEYVEKDLYELFSGYGTIISVTVCKKQNGDSKGYGFVSFNHPSEAAHAIKELNGIFVMGKRIKVELKQTNVEKMKAPSQTLNYQY